MSTVALLGAGRMGSAMVGRLLGGGHHVRVWNRSREPVDALLAAHPGRDLLAARTPEEAVVGTVLVISMLADAAATESVITDQVLAAMPPGAVLCDMATSGVATAERLAARVAAHERGYVDAPVSGSVASVDSGELLVMASGDEALVRQIAPVLASFAAEVLRVGPVGAGQAMKLAVNLVVHHLNAAVSDALLLAEAAGIAPETAYDVLERSAVAAPFVRYKRAAFLDHDAPTAMSLALVAKDLSLVRDYARELGLAHEVTDAVLAQVRHAVDAGWGDRDMARLRVASVTRAGGPGAARNQEV